MKKQLLAASSMLVVAASAMQGQVVPFGVNTGSSGATYSPAVFGGSGIPGPVLTTTLGDGTVLYLGASNRFAAPLLDNNGSGVYTAQAGAGSPSTLGLWNFNFAAFGPGVATSAMARFSSTRRADMGIRGIWDSAFSTTIRVHRRTTQRLPGSTPFFSPHTSTFRSLLPAALKGFLRRQGYFVAVQCLSLPVSPGTPRRFLG